LKKWWSDKYNLPANHGLFLTQSVAELTIEMYEDMYYRRDQLSSQINESGDSREFRELSRQLGFLDKALDNETTHDTGEDDLIDKWERELREGKTPDLTEK